MGTGEPTGQPWRHLLPLKDQQQAGAWETNLNPQDFYKCLVRSFLCFATAGGNFPSLLCIGVEFGQQNQHSIGSFSVDFQMGMVINMGSYLVIVSPCPSD